MSKSTRHPHDIQSNDTKRSFWQYVNPGYIVAGISSLVTAWFSIGENHAKDMYERGIPAFQNIEKIRSDKNAALYADGKFTHYLSKRWEIEKNYRSDYNKLLAEYGIKSPFHKFADLKLHHQIKVALTVAALGGIAWGATYSLTQEKSKGHTVRVQESKHNDDNQIKRS